MVGADREGLAASLRALAGGTAGTELVRGGVRRPGDVVDAVFVFPGQGSQWVGMAVGLLDASPVFAARFAECGAALEGFVEWSLVDVVRGVEGAPGLDRVDVVQPVLWAVMVSLAALWESFGVRPSAVVGHSQGEIAAAVVAGALSLVDGARVVALRSRAIVALAGRGGMVSVALDAGGAAGLVGRWPGRVSVAAVNGPLSTVVSGDAEALDELMVFAQESGVRVRRIEVDYASHSSHVELIEGELGEVLAPVVALEPVVPFLSTVTGEWIDSAQTDAGYWYRNLRRTVCLEPAVARLLVEGHGAFLEMSPHPVLTVPVTETVEAAGADAVVVGSLRRGEGGLERFYLSLAEAWARGVSVDWAPVFEGLSPRRVDLPTYAFQRSHYWLEPKARETVVDGNPGVLDDSFWNSVENDDLDSLAESLGMEDVRSLAEVVPALSSWRRDRINRSTLDAWRYRVAWRPITGRAARAADLTGTWLVVVPAGHESDPLVRQVSAALEERSAGARLLVAGGPAAERDRMADLIRQQTDGTEIGGVLSLLALDESPWPAEGVLPTGLVLTASLLQALGDVRLDAPAVVRDARCRLRPPPRAAAPPAAGDGWGLGRIAALEHPQRWGGLVDLPDTLDDRAASRLVDGLSRDHGGGPARGARIGHLRPEAGARRCTGPRRPTAGGSRPAPSSSPAAPARSAATSPAGWPAAAPSTWCSPAGAARRRPAPPNSSRTGRTGHPGDRGRLRRRRPRRGRRARRRPARRRHRSPRSCTPRASSTTVSSTRSPTTRPRRHAPQGRRRTRSRRRHPPPRPGRVRAVLLHGRHPRRPRTGQLRRGQRLPRRAGRTPPRRGPARHLRRLGHLGGRRHGRARRSPSGSAATACPPMDPDLAIAALQKALDHDEDVPDRRRRRLASSPRPARSPPLRDFPEARKAVAAGGDEPKEADGRRRAAARAQAGRAGPRRAPRRAARPTVRAQAAAVLGHADPDAVARPACLPGPRLRLADRGRTAQPARRGHRAARCPPPSSSTTRPRTPSPPTWTQELFGADATAEPRPQLPTAAVDDDPIAIVGMGCRFPGGVTRPRTCGGWSPTASTPSPRSPPTAAGTSTRLYDPDPDRTGTLLHPDGGFLHDAAEFDAAFFGISPARGRRHGPAAAAAAGDLLGGVRTRRDRTRPRCAAPGPACSSAPTTTTTAAAPAEPPRDSRATSPPAAPAASPPAASPTPSAWRARPSPSTPPAPPRWSPCTSPRRRCGPASATLALAGGVTVMSTPDTFVEFSRQRALAPDGRCKAFSADGRRRRLGRGRRRAPAGAAVRRPPPRAPGAGRRRGTAVNQDGASNGLTAPNGPAQQRVIRQALATAGLSPADVDAVEAHGTGTTPRRPHRGPGPARHLRPGPARRRPLWLGSLKSNIGHTQAAAGVAGVIKMVHGDAARRRCRAPCTPTQPSPHIDWSAGAVRAAAPRQRDWPRGDAPAPRGRLLLRHQRHQRPRHPRGARTAPLRPSRDPAGTTSGGRLPWLLSARGTAGTARPGPPAARPHRRPTRGGPPADLALSLATARAHLDDRAAVVADGTDALADGARRALAEGRENPRVLVTAGPAAGRTAFLFSGQGAQRAGDRPRACTQTVRRPSPTPSTRSARTSTPTSTGRCAT